MIQTYTFTIVHDPQKVWHHGTSFYISAWIIVCVTSSSAVADKPARRAASRLTEKIVANRA